MSFLEMPFLKGSGHGNAKGAWTFWEEGREALPLHRPPKNCQGHYFPQWGRGLGDFGRGAPHPDLPGSAYPGRWWPPARALLGRQGLVCLWRTELLVEGEWKVREKRVQTQGREAPRGDLNADVSLLEFFEEWQFVGTKNLA